MDFVLRRAIQAGHLTYETIWTYVQSLCDDDDPEVLGIIKTAIVLTYDDILAHFRAMSPPPRWLYDYDATLSTTADTRKTTLETTDKEIERILAVSVQQSDTWYPAKRIDVDELEAKPDIFWSTTNTERPYRYIHEKTYQTTGGQIDRLIWFPLPDAAYTFRYWFEKRLGTLTNAGDVPQIPTNGHIALVYGTLVKMAEFDVRVKGGTWDVLFTRAMDSLMALSSTWNPLPQGTEAWGL